jgi:3-deoxy-D-manno-octulosonic-acid transferase
MGRKATGQTTTVIRVPIRHKEKIQQYIQHLKEAESTEQVRTTEQSETPVALSIVQGMGLIDLCKTALCYGISRIDE